MPSLYCTADRLFDATGSPTVQGPVVRIEGDRISSVSGGAPVPPGVEHSAFPGCTILPGLIDTHVHLVFSAAKTNAAIIEQVTRESDEELLARALANARAALYAGVTTVRDCGGRNRVVQQARGRIRRGEAVGAEVLSCGAPITTTRGHCHWLGLIADTQEEVHAAATRMVNEGADFLKVMATGGNMTPSSDPMKAQYDNDTLRLITRLGRHYNRPCAAHVLSRAALPGVVAAHFNTIEHCDWRIEENTYAFDPELAEQIVDQGQYVGLTMSGTARRAFLPELAAVGDGPIRRLDARFDAERRMLDAGVQYTLHSDAGVRWTPIETFALGLRTAVLELRLTPAEAIIAATRTAAAAIGLDDRGIIAYGKRADLLVVEGDPLVDISCLERVRAVMQAGKWFDLPTQKAD
jgi:imidazolonepropionase-like amidohydrolase